MAQYNTFIVQKTSGGRVVLVTSSVRKASALLAPGFRLEVWSDNKKVVTVYDSTRGRLDKYLVAERLYIAKKQAAAERKNQRRRGFCAD